MELIPFHKLSFMLFLSIFLISVSLCPKKGLSQETTPFNLPTFDIQTQSYFHDQQADSFVYSNAKIKWENLILEGGEVRIDRIKGTLVATGYVRFKDGQITATMDRFEMDFRTKRAVLYNLVVYDSGTKAYMTAEKAVRISQDHYVAYGCSITTCDPKDSAWKITSEEIHYYQDNFSSAEGAVFYAGDWPLFYFPVWFWPTTRERQSGLLPPWYAFQTSTEKKFRLGYTVGIPFFWAIAKDQDLTITTRWIELRGRALKLDYQYAFRPGSMRGGVQYERIFENNFVDYTGESDGKDRPVRHKASFGHNQRFDESTRFIVSGFTYGDPQYVREYEGNLSPDPNYEQSVNASINHQFEAGTASLSVLKQQVFSKGCASFECDLDKGHPQRIPEISFGMSDRPWEIPLTIGFGTNAVRFTREIGINGVRTIFSPNVSYQFHLLEYFKVNLGYGKRISMYETFDAQTDQQDSFSQELEFTNVGMNTALERVWSVEEGRFARVKHTVDTGISFETRADVDQSKSAAVNIDGEDQLVAIRLATFSIGNSIRAKRRLFERSIMVTEQTLLRLEERHLRAIVLRRLEVILNKEFFSETDFTDTLDQLSDGNITPEEKEQILTFVKRGLLRPISDKLNRPTHEGPTVGIASFGLSQRYNFLREDKDFSFRGPALEANETEPGEPLLPLEINWSLSPGGSISMSNFSRYHYQLQRIVEYKTTLSVSVPRNSSSINLHNNEISYKTPQNIDHPALRFVEFNNTFSATEKLSLGFSATIDLNTPKETRRRMTSDTVSMTYQGCCYEIKLRMEESVALLTEEEKNTEVKNRTIFLTISLGEVVLPEASQDLNQLTQ